METIRKKTIKLVIKASVLDTDFTPAKVLNGSWT